MTNFIHNTIADIAFITQHRKEMDTEMTKLEEESCILEKRVGRVGTSSIANAGLLVACFVGIIVSMMLTHAVLGVVAGILVFLLLVWRLYIWREHSSILRESSRMQGKVKELRMLSKEMLEVAHPQESE